MKNQNQQKGNHQELSTVATKKNISNAIEDKYGVLCNLDGTRLVMCNEELHDKIVVKKEEKRWFMYFFYRFPFFHV